MRASNYYLLHPQPTLLTLCCGSYVPQVIYDIVDDIKAAMEGKLKAVEEKVWGGG